MSAYTSNGFPLGSIILTLDGALPVEHLAPGDRIITRDRGMVLLGDVTSRRARVETVSIIGGSLGHTCPDDDTLIPADHKVLVRDWRAQALFGQPQALVPARDLADGEFVRLAGMRDMTLFDLSFDGPHILYVDGLELACEPGEALRRAA
ncbi:Hint domain-containing protein [Marimonas lutisalis]|uniref:Hint domain-containing protein n=1 Tax=Marimonas lutisalis TaxID=2545756 RepID=UPI0010F465F3|nr:Hint domain-containing protein [Marimonas lutisalis]